MRKKYTKLMVGLTVLIVCLALLAPAAMAAETIYVPMPAVSIRLTGDVPQESENYVVVLKADNPAFPMPEGSENGEYKLVITGEDMGNFPQIQYSSVGIYTYTVYQVPGSNELGNYDSSIYHVTVYVLNASADGGFEHMVTLRKDDHEEKFDLIEFVNDYEVEIPDEEPPGGDVEPSPSPEPTPTPTPEIEIPEEEIPGGDAEVPKTGDDFLIWPYVVSFAGAGTLLMVLALTRRKKAGE